MSATLIEASTLNCAFLVVMSAILTAVSTLNCMNSGCRGQYLDQNVRLNCAFLVVMSWRNHLTAVSTMNCEFRLSVSHLDQKRQS